MDKLTIEQKKKYICENAKKLSVEDARDVITLLKRRGYKEKIKCDASNANINLDQISKKDINIINEIYSQIHHKINK